jgi:hypothetical protein
MYYNAVKLARAGLLRRHFTMHNRHCPKDHWRFLPGLLTVLGLELILLIVMSFSAFAAGPVPLQDVMNGKISLLSVTVNGSGDFHGQCLNASFVNNTSQTFSVKVPVGLSLVPVNTAAQIMYTAGDESLTVPPGNSKVAFVGFCGQRWNHIPTSSDVFHPGPFATGSLMQTLKNINARQIYDYNAQSAVWNRTDNIDISTNPDAQSFISGGGGGTSTGGGADSGGGVSEGQVAGAAGAAAALLAAWIAANGAMSGATNAASAGLGQDSTATGSVPRNSEELWNTLKQGGPVADELAHSLRDRMLGNYAAGSLPESVDMVGAPPSIHESYDALRDVGRQMGAESEDKWINIKGLIDKGTTVRSIIVGAIAGLAADVLAALSWPWCLGIGLGAGAWDKYGPDAMNIVEPFYDNAEPDEGTPARDGPTFTIQTQQLPNYTQDQLNQMSREDRVKMWQATRTGGSASAPNSLEEWQKIYDSTKKEADQLAADGNSGNEAYKRLCYQRDLANSLRSEPWLPSEQARH